MSLKVHSLDNNMVNLTYKIESYCGDLVLNNIKTIFVRHIWTGVWDRTSPQIRGSVKNPVVYTTYNRIYDLSRGRL